MAKRIKVFRGDRLRDARQRRELTQEDLGTRLGISYTLINRYENGKADPSPEIIVKLTKGLNVSSDFLLGLSDDPAEYMAPRDLSAEEQEMVSALRRGDVKVAFDILRARFLENLPNKPIIPGHEPASNK